MWQRTNLDVLASSYSNIFLIIAILLAIGALLALFLRHGGEAEAVVARFSGMTDANKQQLLTFLKSL